MHGQVIKGESIRVDFSFTDKPHERTPGVYMGRSRRGSSRRYHPYGGSSRDRYYDYRGPPPPYDGYGDPYRGGRYGYDPRDRYYDRPYYDDYYRSRDDRYR